MDRSGLTMRAARPGDAHALAELVNIAGEGLPLYLWTRMAGPGEDPWDVGRDRARRDQASFSYTNAVMAELDGEIVGSLIGYSLPDAPEPIGPDMPPMFVPLQELENMACRTWYVNVLAVYREHRRKGYGARLLARADETASGLAAVGVSLIVSDKNSGARRLYESCGFRLIASRPMVKEDWVADGENWLLMVKRIR